MARAARGRADGRARRAASPTSSPAACASGTAAASSPSSAAGTTAATPCMPSPRSPRRAWPRRGRPCTEHRRTRPGWPRVTAAGVVVVASLGERGGRARRRLARGRRRRSTASSASAAGPGCRRRPRPAVGAVPDDDWSSPSTCRAASTRHGERAPATRVRRRDGDLRRRRSRCTCCRPPRPRSGVLTVVDIGLDLDGGRPRSSG